MPTSCTTKNIQMPPRISIFNMFGPSPLRPIEAHIDKAYDCAKALLPFFDLAIEGNWEDAEASFQKICKIEAEADELKRDIRLHLHKDLYLPVPRSELLTMLMLQDRIANKAKDIAGLVVARKMHVPETIQKDYLKLLQRSIDAAGQARKAINELDDLLEAGFRGNEVKLVQSMLDELDRIENQTDALQHGVRKQIFNLEKELHPMDCISLYKLIEWTGALADRSQNVGEQLQILLAQ